MSGLYDDLDQALRRLLREPAAIAAPILMLAVAIGVNTSLFSIFDEVVLQPPPGIEDPRRLLSIYSADRPDGSTGPGEGFFPVSYPDYRHLRDHSDSFAALAVAAYQPAAVGGTERPEQILAAVVTGDYFRAAGVTPLLGRVFGAQVDAPLGGHPVAVLSEWFWRSRFAASPSAVGQSLEVNRQRLEVIGVAGGSFKGLRTFDQTALWIPLSMRRELYAYSDLVEDPAWRLFDCVGRLRPGVPVERVAAELTAYSDRLAAELPDSHRNRRFRALPIGGLDPAERDRYRRTGFTILAVTGFVLLAACANMTSLLLLRAARRRGERAVRWALGATRGSLARQLFLEHAFLVLVASVLSLVVALGGIAVLRAQRPPFLTEVQLQPELDGHALLFTAAAAGIALLLVAVLPALVVRPPGRPASSGRHGTAVDHRDGSGASRRLREGLVVAQVALSAVGLVGAALFLQSFLATRAVDPGVERERLAMLTFDLDLAGYEAARGRGFHELLLARVAELPAVRRAALASQPPLTPLGMLRTTYVDGDDAGSLIRVNAVTPGYFETVGVELLAGRDFRAGDDEQAAPVAIVNETMARRSWPGRDAVGQSFRWRGELERPIRVIGVASNGKYVSLGEEETPYVYVPMAQRYGGGATLHVRVSDRPALLLPALSKLFRELDPDLPVIQSATMEDRLDEALWAPRTIASILTAFSLLVLILALTGLYGAVSDSAARRRFEIGVRLTLGARRREVSWLVLRHGLALVVVGAVVGLATGHLGQRLFAGLLHGMPPSFPVLYAAVACTLLAVSAAALYLPARRAASVDPARVLRHDP